MNDPGPSPEQFAQVAAMMPKFKREAVGNKIITGNGAIKNACAICTKFYGGAFKADKQPHCPSCRKNLRDGFCAFVTMDGARHQFFRHEKMPKEWSGAVFTIPADRMDVLERRFAEMN